MAEREENRLLFALIKLLDEPDDAAYEKIRQSILARGNEALPLLEHSLENAFEPIVQERIGEIVATLKQENLLARFSNWAHSDAPDLLEGHLLATRTAYPDLDEGLLLRQMEQLKMEVWIELNDHLTALENVKVLNHILYDVHGFSGSEMNPPPPESHFLNTLLEGKRGNPVALGMLYITLARRLGLPISGVNLPQHFILAYLNDPTATNPASEDILFYINPFNKGAVFTRREIDLYLKQMKYKPDRSYFEPCSNPVIIKRLLHSLKHTYSLMGASEKVVNLDYLLKILG